MQTIRRKVTLREMPDGRWLYKEHGMYYRSLANCLRLVQVDNDAIAENGRVAVVTLMTYEPITDAGTELIKRIIAKG